jgi:hypothetical protein
MTKGLTVFEPATKNQTWALYACYKKDLRNLGLSKAEASMLIDDFNRGVNKELPKKYQTMFDNLTTDPYKVSSKVYEVVKAAENTISKANKAANKKAKVSPLFAYMTSNEVAQELLSVLGAEFRIGGVITNDIDKTDKKAYLMLGGGCGFAHLQWDKRNKKVGEIIKESNLIKQEVEKYYISLIDPNYIAKLQKSGNPIQAHFMQNLSYNTSWNYKIIRYLNDLGYKNITTTSRYD